jgi:hypothetical protein
MRGTRQVLGGLVAVAVGLSACTGPETAEEPAPSTPTESATTEAAPMGVNVGVVLPPRVGLSAAATERLEGDLARLAEQFGPDLRSVRVVTPPAAELAPDLAAVLTDRGTQLVCVLGPGALETVLAEVALHPQLRYCAAPVAEGTELPPQVVGRDVRAEELGRTVGTVAALIGTGPVGFVDGSDELAPAAFRTGLLAGLGDRELVEGEGPASEAVAQVLAAGAGVVVLDPGAGAADAVGLATRSVPVLVPAGVPGAAADEDAIALSWRVRWDRLVAAAVEAHLGVDPPPPTSLGVAEGLFEVTLGPAAPAGAAAALEAVLTELTGAATSDEPDPTEDGTP